MTGTGYLRQQFAYWTIAIGALIAATSVAAAIVPAPPVIAAKGYLLIDYQSGQILIEENADTMVEPASLTKLMTAYVVFKELKSGNLTLQDQVTISEKAWRTEGSRTFVEVGKQVSVETLLLGMIVQSGNDATVALAEHIAGTEEVFATLMNSIAQELGMLSTHFVNSTGLPNKEHYTTPRDLAKLTQQVILEFPDYYQWYSVREFTYNDITQYNRNKLLWRDNSVDGVKTGHTDSAGYCLVASAKRDDMRLISVILGAKGENSRAQETQKLLNYGFRFFETHRLYGAKEPLTTVRIWKGNLDNLPMGLNEELFVTIPRGQYENLNAQVNLPSTITAPAAIGQQMGSVNITLEGQPIAERPLVALQDVQEGGLVDRLLDEIMLMLK